MTSRLSNHLVAILLLVIGWAFPVQSTTLVADLDLDQVSITIDFNGESLLLFGAVSGGTASDIIVIFKGPEVPLAVRKKERASGIWMNRQTIIWQNLPAFIIFFLTERWMKFCLKSSRAGCASAQSTSACALERQSWTKKLRSCGGARFLEI